MSRPRPATLRDIDAAALALPEVTRDPESGGRPAVLLLERDLGRLTSDEVREVVTDAWLHRAPRRLAKEWLAGAGTESH